MSKDKLDHRAFIDMNGGYQSTYIGVDKEAHDAWMKLNTWNLSRDDLIRLSYFNGCLENGSDGLEPRNGNGNNNSSGDAVYISPNGSVLTRSMVSYWLDDCRSFIHGYKVAIAAHITGDAGVRLEGGNLKGGA